jgi:hypothetical protein
VRVNKWLLPILALVLILGTVGIAQAAGLWVVSGREMVDLAQLTGGDDVKGWMTLQQVADGTGIETTALVAKLGLPADLAPETVLKEIEGIVEGFDITAVRAVVDESLGLTPAAADEATTQEVPAAEAEAEASLAAKAIAEPMAEPTSLATPLATPTAAHAPTGTGTGTGDGEDQPAVTSAASIKGSHTLQQIVDGTGVDLAALVSTLQLPAGTDPQTTVRELVQGGRLSEVDEVRTAVAALQ